MSTQRLPMALSLDGLGDDARAAFDLAAQAGFGAVALPTNHPQLRPADLGESARRHLLRTLAGRHLGIDAIRVAAPRAGLTDPATIDRTIDNARAAMQLAFDLGVRTVALHIGSLATLKGGPEALIPAARELAMEADRAGVTLALGSDEADKLRALLAAVAFARARANFEPAGAIAAGEDPVAVAERMQGMIGELTLADAVRAGQQLRAVELGQGQVPVEDLLEALRAQDFQGPTVVDVRDLANPAAGARHAGATLRALLTKP